MPQRSHTLCTFPARLYKHTCAFVNTVFVNTPCVTSAVPWYKSPSRCNQGHSGTYASAAALLSQPLKIIRRKKSWPPEENQASIS